MRILFLSHAFPGTFQHIAEYFGATGEHSVGFVAEYGRRDLHIPGVERIIAGKPKDRTSGDKSAYSRIDAAEHDVRMAMQRGGATALRLLRLRQKGFVPHMVLASAAMGNSFYLRDIFPEAFIVAHADWYYARKAPAARPRKAAFDDVPGAPERVRNLVQMNALLDGDLAVTSTEWQRAQFPALLAERMIVLPRCVDTDFFAPQPDARRPGARLPQGANCPASTPSAEVWPSGCNDAEELVTFSGRGMEPFRGVPQFFRCLPLLLQKRPRCHVLVMGAGPEAGGTALPALREKLRALPPEHAARVHMLPFVPLNMYRRLLQASDVHVYLTAPFMLSSGLFEAMSCGCLVAGSDTEPVREVVRHGENGFLCEFWEPGALAGAIADLLERSSALDGVREAARRAMLERHSRPTLMQRQADTLLRVYAAWRERS